MKKKILSLLVLLAAAVTGAWATDAIPAYNLSVAESDNGSGTISYTVQDKDDAEKITENAKGANEGDKVTVAITPDEGWVVDIDNVTVEVYRYWEGSRRAQATVPMQRTVDLDYKGKDANGVATYTFVMPASNVKVKGAYKKLSTLYFDPADRTNLMEVKVDGIVRNLEDSKTVKIEKVEKVIEGTEITLTANTGYKFRKVEVKKKGAGKPVSEITPDDIFKVIASDGIIYDNIAAAESAGTVAQGLIVYVGSNTGNENYNHGLALALNDENSNTQGGAINACNAKNTSTPIVDALWILPSQGQWNTMFNAAGGDWKLRDCFSSAGGNNMVKDGEYWSSSGDSEWVIYWMFTAYDWEGTWGDIQPYYNYSCNVRACIVF